MKIAFNRKIINGPFGGGNHILYLLTAYLKTRGVEVVFSLDCDIDIIVIMDVRDEICCFSSVQISNFIKKHKNVKVIHRINENTAHRCGSFDMDGLIIKRNKDLASKTIFISQYLSDYFYKNGLSILNSCIIKNGVNRKIFNYFPTVHKQGEPIKIIIHHWSTNIMKGYKIYDDLARYCHNNPNIAKFTFMGNCPNGFLLGANKILPQPYEIIPGYLHQFDVYVTASLYEPGGCHIVEGMSCGLIPVVMENTGGCLEYSSGYNIVFKDEKDLFSIIEKMYNNFDFFIDKRNEMENYSYGSEDMCKEYLSVFEEVMGCMH